MLEPFYGPVHLEPTYLVYHLQGSSAHDLIRGLTRQTERKSTPMKRSGQFFFIWCSWRTSSIWYNGVCVLDESTHGITTPSNSGYSVDFAYVNSSHGFEVTVGDVFAVASFHNVNVSVDVTTCIVNSVNDTFFLVSQNRRVCREGLHLVLHQPSTMKVHDKWDAEFPALAIIIVASMISDFVSRSSYGIPVLGITCSGIDVRQ